MRKFIITAASLLALAVPAAGLASVAVDANGVGFVGKGDVQTALNLKNDAAMQDLFKKDGIKFTASVDRVIADYEMSCGPANTGVTMHRIITQPATMVVEAKANTNNAGKLTTGWDLTGKLTGEVLSVGNATMTETLLPGRLLPLDARQHHPVRQGDHRRPEGQRHRAAEHPGRAVVAPVA